MDSSKRCSSSPSSSPTSLLSNNSSSPVSVSTCEEPFDFLFKIVLIGDTGVGKSCLLIRFADDSYNDRMTTTIGVDFRIRTMIVHGKRVKLQVWDSAGQERFRSLTSSYYRGAHAVAIVFDLTSFDTIDTVVTNWISEIDTHCQNQHVKKLLIGNKNDLLAYRQVSTQHAKATADACGGMTYIETSAKTACNVHQAFELIVKDLLESEEHSKNFKNEQDPDTIRISEVLKQAQHEQNPNNKKSCC